MKCQQDDLYRAEERAFRRLSLPGLSVSDAQRLVDRWRELPWFEENFPNVVNVQVVGRRSDRRGSSGGLVSCEPRSHVAVIEMAPCHLNPLYVAHEVIHPLCQSRYGNGSHSPAFARHYLELVYLGLGTEAYQVLREEFEKDNVDHRGWS